MKTDRSSVRCLALAALISAVLMAVGVAGAQNTPKIHPTSPKVQSGIVTAVRQVKAYPYALGADTDTWGNISCQAEAADQVSIKRTTIFRVETESHFYDLSKVCGMGGDFRWPRFYNGNDNTDYDTWNRYEQLKIGDRVKMVFKKSTVQLSMSRCAKLGLIAKPRPEAVGSLVIPTFSVGSHEYRNRCIYKVPIMHVRIKWSTTEVAGAGAHGTDTYVQTWDFRLVGEGPMTAAQTTKLGLKYTATLPPAW